MLSRYIQAALDRAHYEIIEEEEPYYGSIPGLDGVWASGVSLESCRERLAEVVEDWVFVSIARGLPIPPLGDVALRQPDRVSKVNPARGFYEKLGFLVTSVSDTHHCMRWSPRGE